MSTAFIPYIFLDGAAEEALRFYEAAFDAQVTFRQTFGDGPQHAERPFSEEEKRRIAHAALNVGDAVLYVADVWPPGADDRESRRVNICVVAPDAETTRRYYEALRVGGRTDEPLRATYFSPAYAVVTDKFGVCFQLFTQRGQS